MAAARGGVTAAATATGAAVRGKTTKYLLFDLDGTLYPNENGYRDHILSSVWEYMHEHLGVPRSTPAEHIWRPLFDQYHQSERAFRAQGWMDDSHHVHYWRYIRRDVAKFLRPDPELDTFLAALPAACPKYIFTNAREEQAEEALECLGVRHHFVGVFGADLMGDVCKPERAAFDKVLAALGEKEEEEAEGDGERSYSNVVFFEDSFKNLMAAKAMGMKTVLIHSATTVKEEGRSEKDFHRVDAVVPRLALPLVRDAAPFLWED